MESIVILLLTMVILMIVLKLMFAELDRKTAIKKGNIKYFINLSKEFKYTRALHMVLLLVICFVLFSEINLFTIDGLLVLGLFIVIGMISDIVSQFAYYKYANIRFKKDIEEALAFVEEIKQEGNKEFIQDEIVTFPNKYSFEQIVENEIYEEDHVSFVTMDGGQFVNKIKNLPKVTYVIDAFEKTSETLLQNKLVKLVKFTKDQLLPFKKEKLDVVVSKDANFNFSEVFRVLKEDGSFILNQAGSDNLIEIGTLFYPLRFRRLWNVATCEAELNDSGFVVLAQDEDRSQMRFRSMSAILHYLKTVANDKVEDIETYINQFAYIYRQIKTQGYFIVTTHMFYIVAKKRSGLLNKEISSNNRNIL